MDGKRQTLVIESMHRFRVGRDMFALCVIDLRAEYRTVLLRHAFDRIGMPRVPFVIRLRVGGTYPVGSSLKKCDVHVHFEGIELATESFQDPQRIKSRWNSVVEVLDY